MPVIRYIIHNSKELDFLDNIEDIPSETVRAIKTLRRKEYEKKQYIRQKKLDRICKN